MTTPVNTFESLLSVVVRDNNNDLNKATLAWT